MQTNILFVLVNKLKLKICSSLSRLNKLSLKK